MIGPGKTIGILGGGQLGRMVILAGRPMGLHFHVFEPAEGCTAGKVADKCVSAPYTDREALVSFAEGVDVVTQEFENIDAGALEFLQERIPVHPNPTVLHIAQNRFREKQYLKASGIPHVPFEVVDSADSLERAVEALGLPVVVKTADFGYDGKGQIKIAKDEDWKAADIWQRMGAPRLAVVEKWIHFQCEISAICARDIGGVAQVFPVAENIHRNHILHQSIVPARVDPVIAERAAELAAEMAESLDVIGLLAVEFFVSTDGEVLVNEMAPRPHNSGHYSMDACVTGQFEQHVRMVCGLGAGSTALLKPVVMTNLLGDLWAEGEPDWVKIMNTPSAKLHLYDKGEARSGRKMGHFNVLADEVETALMTANTIFESLQTP